MDAEQLNESEIETLRKGALGAGMVVAVSDRGFFDSFKEAGALAKHLSAARKNADSPLIRRIAEGGGGFGLTSSPEEIESETLDALRSSAAVLERKAPDELETYRAFVLELARSVSSAAGGGEDVEAAKIGQLSAALGGSSSREAAE